MLVSCSDDHLLHPLRAWSPTAHGGTLAGNATSCCSTYNNLALEAHPDGTLDKDPSLDCEIHEGGWTSESESDSNHSERLPYIAYTYLATLPTLNLAFRRRSRQSLAVCRVSLLVDLPPPPRSSSSSTATSTMSAVSTPVPSSGYASPSPAPLTAAPAAPKPNSHHPHPKPKPLNVFSNDGSFLERFQRLKKVRCVPF